MKVTSNRKYRMQARALGAILVLSTLVISTISCVSGGFRTTRSVARWNNSNHVIIRVLLYPVVLPVLLIAVVLDQAIFNTIDFWTGKVSILAEHHEKDGMQVDVEHSRTPLRQSVFTVTSRDGTRTITELRETPSGKIEVYVDGVKHSEALSINELVSTWTSPYSPS